MGHQKRPPTYERTDSTAVLDLQQSVCTMSILYELVFFCRNLRLQLKLSDFKILKLGLCGFIKIRKSAGLKHLLVLWGASTQGSALNRRQYENK